jgi:NhaA family Na+:H+ antiporter
VSCPGSSRLRLAERPKGMGWRDLTASSLLGGVGFTVSLLIAELAPSGVASDRAKVAVLLASAITSLSAAVLLLRRNKAHGALKT